MESELAIRVKLENRVVSTEKNCAPRSLAREADVGETSSANGTRLHGRRRSPSTPSTSRKPSGNSDQHVADLFVSRRQNELHVGILRVCLGQRLGDCQRFLKRRECLFAPSRRLERVAQVAIAKRKIGLQRGTLLRADGRRTGRQQIFKDRAIRLCRFDRGLGITEEKQRAKSIPAAWRCWRRCAGLRRV